jgi:hypothetical protein
MVSPAWRNVSSETCRASSAGKPIIHGIALLGWQPARDLAHDRNDLLHDITAGAAGSTSQQIPNRGADHRLGVVRARKLPIVLTLAAHRDREAAQGGEGGPLGASGRHPDPCGLPSPPARQGGLRVGMGEGGVWAIGRTACPAGQRRQGQCSPDMSCGC